MRLSGRLEKVEPPSVTSLVYANEYTLVSASSNAKRYARFKPFAHIEDGTYLLTSLSNDGCGPHETLLTDFV